jgi:(R,R)-butanediol dehydrogenase/meso-butanediol dehydrogenase/diacetyl reductase
MRAAVFEGAGKNLEIRDVPVPAPGPGEMLIRVERCGICGSDLHLTDSASCYNPPAGSIIGHEFAGEIVDLGEGTSGTWKEGQRITALPFIGCGKCAHCLNGDSFFCPDVRSKTSGRSSGGFAEYTVVGAPEALLLPDQMSWDEGAFIEPIAVGVHAVARAKLPLGARVLIVGSGPVGMAVAACARAAGAGTIVVTSRSATRADLCRKMGATEFMKNDEHLAESFAKLAGGPPEFVFECVGLPGMLDLCSGLAAPRGTVVMIGACLQQEKLLPIVPTMKELSIQFVVCYVKQDFEVALAMIASGRVDPLLMHSDTITMAEFPEAFEALRERSTQCKVLLAPGR